MMKCSRIIDVGGINPVGQSNYGEVGVYEPTASILLISSPSLALYASPTGSSDHDFSRVNKKILMF